MKKNIYFHIDELNRDSVVASALYFKLKNKFNFYLGNRIYSHLLKYFDIFDIYIFPNVETLEGAFGSPNNCKGTVYILPNESISGSTKVSRRLTLHLTGTIKNKKLKEKWLKKVDQFFLWGKSHYKVLKNYSKKLSKKSIIVGHPRHDKICYKNFNNKNIYKKKIGLISRFDLINIFDNRHNFENIYNAWLDKFNFQWMFDDKRNTEHQWFNSILDFRFFLDIIKLLSDKKYQVSLRPHPRENRDNWIKFKKKYNLNIKISANEEPFLNWIASQDILVSSASTSLYDCVLMKKKIILIDRFSKDRKSHGNLYLDDFDPIFKFIPRPKNLYQFENLLNKPKSIQFNKGIKKLLSDEINYPYHTSSIEKISTFIENNNKGNKNFKLSNIILIFIFLLIQNYHAFKFFIKKLFKFKEKSSIFSIGILRYLKICHYFKR